MPRIKNTRSTTIYWLVDVRPGVLSDHPNGKPFYCGKTVESPEKRLHGHRTAARSHPNRRLYLRLAECGKQVRIERMEVVPVSENWRARERFWIATLRHFHPDCVNVSSGGDGVPGLVHSAKTRALWSAQRKGKKLGPMTSETRVKIGAANKGRPVSEETRTKHREIASNRTAEHCAKISAANTGRKLSTEHCAKLSNVRKGKLKSPEHRAKIAAAHIGKTHTAESRAKMSASVRARCAA